MMCKMDLTLLFKLLLVFTYFSGIDAVWIVAEVKEINWQQNCIQDRNCESMDLSLVLDSNSVEGSTQSSWQLNDVLKNPQNSKMFAYWSEEIRLTNITLKSLLSAKDQLFGVDRPCDHSSALHIFSPMIKTSAYNAPQNWSGSQVDSDKRQTIGLVGKCFHVIIEVRLYTHNCPWCVPSSGHKQVDSENSVINTMDKLAESPTVIAFMLFTLFLVLIGIILCTITLHNSKKNNNAYHPQYTSSSLSNLPFNRAHSMISNIPMPPILRPPLAPDNPLRISGHKIHEASICPYYETLDSHTLQNAQMLQNAHILQKTTKDASENYDSAFDQSLGGSPNSSFSAGPNISADSGRCSPQLAQQQMMRSRAEYV